jgi:hypothetical protein
VASQKDGPWYSAIHKWLSRNRPKTGTCQDCGVEGRTEFANVSGEYRRSMDDYVEVCRPCHRKRDSTGMCRKGHAFTPDNTYVQESTGQRFCRTCARAREAARRRKDSSDEAAKLAEALS